MVISGNFGLVLSFIYIPLCYNSASKQLHVHSKFELKVPGLEVLNYLIAGVFSVFFVVIMTEDLVKTYFSS